MTVDVHELHAGAEQAGRSTSEIRRVYNVFGRILKEGERAAAENSDDEIFATAQEWAELLAGWYQEYRQDTFIFWPVGAGSATQVERFAEEVAPSVRIQVG